MIRISTIFIAICMVLVAASLGLVLHAVAGFSGTESAIVALTALTFLILLSPFALAALISGRLFEDRRSYRVQHDLDAIRTRFEQQPRWPSSSATGKRR